MRCPRACPAALAVALVLCLPATALPLDLATGAVAVPWTSVYDAARDERKLRDIAADKKIALGIKAALAEKNPRQALAVKVYCYLRRVTLLGQLADENFKNFAVATAKKASGVKGVATHWEAPTDTTAADVEIAAKLRTALIADKDISATQVETEVFGGKVYLIGMVRTAKDAAKAQAIAKGVKGVTSVTSLLIPTRK